MQIRTDSEIISRVLNGEHQLYAELVNRHQNFVFTIALKYAPIREDAEEIAQDVFIKAFKALATFRGDSKFTTWLYSITHSTSLSFLRKKKLDVRSLDNEHVFEAADNQSAAPRPDTIEHKSRSAMVAKAIQLLSPDDATIITLFYKGEQSLDEIGTVMGIEPNTVKVKLHRARQRLREKMEKYFVQDVKDLNY